MCVFSDIVRVSAWPFICTGHTCVSVYGHSQISIYMQIVRPVSNSHVCVLGVDEMSSMQSTRAQNEPGRVEQSWSQLPFHHHPHCGNVKPRGHCQSSQFCCLLGSQPARNLGGREERRRRRRPGSSLGRERRNSDTEQGEEEEP